MTPRTDWISWRMAPGSGAFWLMGTTIRPPNWRWRQAARIAGVSGPWKPTIITAPISWRRVIPPGPSAASCSLLAKGPVVPGVGVVVAIGRAVPDGPMAAAGGPQLATARAAPRQTSRRMAGGSVLRGRSFRPQEPESTQPFVDFLARRVQPRRVFHVAFPLALRQAGRGLRVSQRLRGADVTGPRQGEHRPRRTPALHLHGHRLPQAGVTPVRISYQSRKGTKGGQILREYPIQFKLWRFRALTLATALLGAAAPTVSLAVAAVPVQASSVGFNSPGNLLISDQFHNRATQGNQKPNATVGSFGQARP